MVISTEVTALLDAVPVAEWPRVWQLIERIDLLTSAATRAARQSADGDCFWQFALSADEAAALAAPLA
jgi:hypothetical protein